MQKENKTRRIIKRIFYSLFSFRKNIKQQRLIKFVSKKHTTLCILA